MYWDNCKGCRLKGKRPVFAEFSMANGGPEIGIVAEAPGAAEDATGKPFQGRAGEELNRAISTVSKVLHSDGGDGISRDHLFISNVVMCRPPDNQLTSNEVKCCFPLLEQSLQGVPSLKVIIPMGNTALSKLMGFGGKHSGGITKHRGRVIYSKYGALVPTFHPAYWLRNQGYRDSQGRSIFDIIVDDLLLAVRYSRGEFDSNEDYAVLTTLQDMQAFIQELKNSKGFAYDCETTGLSVFEDCVVGIAFSHAEEFARYIPIRAFNRQGELDYFGPFADHASRRHLYKKLSLLMSSPVPKIGHSLVFDTQFIQREFGVWPANQVHDTMLAAHLLNSEGGPFKLEVLIGRFFPGLVKYKALRRELFKSEKQADEQEAGVGRLPMDKLSVYACGDADGTIRLARKYRRELQDAGLTPLYTKTVVMPMMEAIARAQYIGVAIDVDRGVELSRRYTMEATRLRLKFQDEIFRLFGMEKFNPNSQPQTTELLYSRMGFPTPERTTGSGAPPTDRDIMIEFYLGKNTPKEFKNILSWIMEYGKIEDARSTFIDGPLSKVVDGVLHPDIVQIGTRTGRLSCRNPNLMNLPRDAEANPWAAEVKTMYVARPGYVLLTPDFSQIELRVSAFYTQDQVMLRAYRNEEDVHKNTASEIFSVPIDQVSKDQRSTAKKVNFAVLYAVGGLTLYRQIVYADSRPEVVGRMSAMYTVDDCKRFIRGFFRKYKNYGPWMSETIEFARKYGYVQNHFGRRRYIEGIHSDSEGIRRHAENQAVNTRIQGTAADIANRAFQRISREFPHHIARPLLMVHDMLMIECREDHVETVKPRVTELMEDPCGRLGQVVPIKVSMEQGKRWKEIG